MALGQFHALALKNDGTLWAWGFNPSGELGDGTTIDRSTPVQVQIPTGVKSVSVGDFHSSAVMSDGTLWTWGFNPFGQLCDGTTTDHSTPAQVPSLAGVKAVTAREEHTLALRDDGTVWGCGWNQFGQLGDGTTTDRSTPVPVLNSNGTPFSGVTAITTGAGHVLAKVETPVQIAQPPQLTVNKVLVHPNPSRLRLFNLRIDGVTVRANVNGGGTGRLEMSSGNYMVSETGGTNTDLNDFTAVFGGDCAADGSVTLVPNDKKTCTITNYDHAGGCSSQRPICCEPGSGQNGCSTCVPLGAECP
jgi:hypothetical protein